MLMAIAPTTPMAYNEARASTESSTFSTTTGRIVAMNNGIQGTPKPFNSENTSGNSRSRAMTYNNDTIPVRAVFTADSSSMPNTQPTTSPNRGLTNTSPMYRSKSF